MRKVGTGAISRELPLCWTRGTTPSRAEGHGRTLARKLRKAVLLGVCSTPSTHLPLIYPCSIHSPIHLFIHLSTHRLSIDLPPSIHPSTHTYTQTFSFPSIHPYTPTHIHTHSFICPSIHPSLHPSIHLTCLSIHLHTHSHTLIHPFIHLSMHLSIQPSRHTHICPFIHLSIYPSTHPFIYLSCLPSSYTHTDPCLFTHLPIHPFIHPSLFASIQLFSHIYIKLSLLGLHPRPAGVPRLGVKSEIHLLVYATTTATVDLSHVCNPHHSSRQYPLPTHGARPGIEPTSSWIHPRVHFCCATTGTPTLSCIYPP